MPTPLAPAERNVTAPARAQRRSRKPVTTLVSMLPKTTYNEADETEGTVRSPTYVRVQCQLLQWLGLHASDTLTVQQAHSWTENIAKDKHPQAKDALRLCYYMRSQGFDTYAEFQKNKMSLYIANQDPEVGSPMPELLYWNQNFLNSELAHEVRTVPVLSGARRERRNALPSDLRHPTAQELLGSLRTVDAAGTAANRARSANNPAVAGRGGHGQVTEDNGRENGNDQPTMGSPAARIDAARAELETLLLSNFPDTAAIDAAISQVAELNGQGS
ncbi:hypothetical protein G6011_09257 [Alternaria panax]|uniref:Uncharacterized protein n=1 Tax=Alternaria panax TaxID=48097 RepID=A0AAD4NPP6_9PLEO|nr:hypothetical protein G6011_09257 [Alternaria panax]